MNGLFLEYHCSNKPDADTIRACDDGARAMQTLIVETAKAVAPGLTPLIWLISRVKLRTVCTDKVIYTFPLIGWKNGGR